MSNYKTDHARTTKETKKIEREPDMSILHYTAKPTPNFPFGAIGASVSDVIKATARSARVPKDYVATNLIAAAAMCIGNAREIELKPEFVQPAALWCMNIGERPARHAANTFITRTLDKVQAHMPSPCAGQAATTTSEKTAKRRVKQHNQRRSEAAEITRSAIYISDANSEKLIRAQAETRRGVGMISEDLAGRISDQRAALLMTAFEGHAFTYERMRDNDVKHIPNFAASFIVGKHQEDLIQQIVSPYLESSFFARFLPCWPDDAGTLPWESAADTLEMQAILTRIASIELDRDQSGEYLPARLRMSKAAAEGFWTWATRANRTANSMNDVRYREVLSKAVSQVARMSLVIEHLTWATENPHLDSPAEISKESVQVAIRIYDDYFRPMWRKILGSAAERTPRKLARSMARHIVSLELELARTTELWKAATQCAPHRPTQDDFRKALHLMCRKGWLTIAPSGVKGVVTEYRVNAQIWSQL